MNHPTFDLKVWRARLRGASGNLLFVGQPRDRTGSMLFSDSPVAIVLMEKCRRDAIARGLDLGPSVPVDRFVFGRGEPPLRHLTKVNGLPYRPAGLAWPHDYNGNPMAFLCQFCFADSRNIVGGLPGDVLVVFARTRNDPLPAKTIAEIIGSRPSLIVNPCYHDSLKIEWYPMGLEHLATEDEVPDTSIVFPTCYGVRYRSRDYVDESLAVPGLARVLPDYLRPDYERTTARVLHALARHCGTKIGGIPFGFNPPEIEPRGRYVASFAGIGFASDCVYPWVNQSEPLTLRDCTNDENVLDCASGIHFFLTGDGMVNWDRETM